MILFVACGLLLVWCYGRGRYYDGRIDALRETKQWLEEIRSHYK